MPGYGTSRQGFHFQFITTPTADTTGTCLYLHFDNKRYLFGQIAEGTQRACIERGVGLKKVRDIFVTGRPRWENTGGLIGAILTMSDVQAREAEDSEDGKRPRLNLHGAPGLLHTLACARRFVFRTGMPLSVFETFPEDQKLLTEPTWADENIQVWALPIPPRNEGPMSNGSEAAKNLSSQEPYDQKRISKSKQVSEQSQNARRSILRDMFDSDWRRDRLVEVPFDEVILPAVVWQRDSSTKELISTRVESVSEVPHILPGTRVLVRNPWPASLIGELPSAEDLPFNTSMCYIVKGYPQRGRFDPNIAKSLGVKPGRSFGVLADGHPVQLENGSVITPEMVLGPMKPGRGIAIIDLPDEGYIVNLLKRPEFKDEAFMEGIETMVWIADSRTVRTLRLDFLRDFPKIKHVLTSSDTCPNYLAMESSAASAIRLSRIWEGAFPVPLHNNTGIAQAPGLDLLNPGDESSRATLASQAILAERGLRIQVEPDFAIERAEVPRFLDEALVVQNMPKQVHELAAPARLELSDHEKDWGMDPQIITLGTGSAVPSKYRNVSATLLRIPGHGSYLFDCGENTMGQLRRIFDDQSLQELMMDLRMIWISHLHADHHLGTVSVLTQWQSYQRFDNYTPIGPIKPLYVVGEEHMIGFLEDYSSIQDFKDVRKVVATAAGGRGMTLNGEPFTFQGTGTRVKKLESCLVSHCYGAQAVSVTFDNGFKFSYSGDCRPSEQFAKIGAHSDVLVHEATFDDGMEGDAMAKKHSTTGEALAVGAKMGAKNVILTHFSQRYQKIPVMSDVKLPKDVRFEEARDIAADVAGPVDEAVTEDAELPKSMTSTSNAADTALLDAIIAQTLKPEEIPPLDMNVCVAFDYMRIRVSEIKYMQKFTTALQALFNVENDDLLEAMTPQQKNEQVNRNKVTGLKKAKDVGGDEAVIGNEEAAKPTSKTQMKKQARLKKHLENMRRSDTKEPQSAEGEANGSANTVWPKSKTQVRRVSSRETQDENGSPSGKRAKVEGKATAELLENHLVSSRTVVPDMLLEPKGQEGGEQMKDSVS